MTKILRRAVLPIWILTSACASDASSDLAVKVDTIPGGVVRTITERPIERGRWALEQVREIQPDEGTPEELLNPAGVLLADDGSLLVVESQPAQVKVFDASGAHVRTFGRAGSGPGEFRAAFATLRGDTLAVQDPAQSRVSTILWRTGELIATRRSTCCYWSPIDVDAAGLIWLRTISQPPDTTFPFTQGFLRMTMTGETIDTMWAYERRDLPEAKPWLVREGGLVRMAMTPPLQPRGHFVVDPGGALITGWSGEYMLRTTRDGRDTVALFGRPWASTPVPAAERSAIVERKIRDMRAESPSGHSEEVLRASLDPDLIPSSRPAYDAVAVDRAGRRWIRLDTGDTTRLTLDLFSPDGRWLDEVSVSAEGWPRDSWAPTGWSRDEVAVVLEGDDGRPLVRVYAILRR